MDRDGAAAWVEAYVAAWRTPGVEPLADLFAADVRYVVSPWKDPIVGLDAIGRFWEAGRTGPDEVFELSHEIVAVEGDTAVVRVAVDYGTGSRWKDLWVVAFDEDGRCAMFEEWPFAPGQHDGQDDVPAAHEQRQTGAMRPVGVHHVSINVRDVDEALRFYTDVLGLGVRDDRPDFGFGGAWLQAGSQQVHLIEAGPPQDLGQHFALLVDDLDAVVAELRERGVAVGDPSPVGTSRQAFVSDPSGNLVELHQPG